MRTKLILELGCNHNGNVDNARRMIDEAADLGVWGIKFQKRDLGSIPEALARAPRDPETAFGRTYLEHRQALELGADDIEELVLFARKTGLAAGVTVFDEPSFHAMKSIPFTFMKTPSQLYTAARLNYLILDWEVNGEGRMTMASTGMHDDGEIFSCDHFGAHTVTMYCRSMYPFPPSKAALSRMAALKFRLGGASILGYSSHDKDCLVVPWAVAMGAEYVERHYTLSRTLKGADHKTVSSTYHDIKALKETLRSVEEMVGDSEQLDVDELKVRKQFRGF